MSEVYEWKIVANGPHISYAAAAYYNGFIYLHGGVNKARSTEPAAGLYKFSIEAKTWSSIEKPGSPSLSHHCCVLIENHYLLFIGGWNGKERSAEVYLFDCQNEKWVKVATQGFPLGAGLSSHSATLLSNGDILVVGREGSLRTQRRSGNAFILSGSPSKGLFTYKDYPMGVASRSGHTTTCTKSSVAIVGGRSDKLTELHRLPCKGVASSVSSELCSSLVRAEACQPVTKLPSGRKGHSACGIGDQILIYGGETFDVKNKEPVSEMYLIDSKDSYTWKYLGKTNLPRAGHCCISCEHGVFIHGGLGEKNIVTNLTCKLTAK